MSIVAKLAAIGHSFLDRFGAIQAQASLDADDQRQYPGASWFAGLGVTGMPYGPTERGFVEGVLIDRVGPYSGIVIAARDRRGTNIYGTLKPGDSVLHSTGPDAKTQVLCKREGDVVAMLTEDSRQKTCGIIIEGHEDRATFAFFGWVIQVTRDGGIVMSSKNGLHGLTITDDGVHVRGNVVLGGTTPTPGMYLMMGPATGSPGGAASVPMFPALGVAIGQ